MRAQVMALCLAGMITGASAQSINGLTVSDAWARPTASATANAAIYFTITDTGAPDSLVGASTQAAATAQLHESTVKKGVSSMHSVNGPVTIDQQHKFVASPGGYHLMLTGMKRQLLAGQTILLTLSFQHAGNIVVPVRVRADADAKSGKGNMDGMTMSH